MTVARLLLIALLVAAPSAAALAHTGQRAFILLLPTDLYMVGGALVVALSFVVMALTPSSALRAVERARWGLGAVPVWRVPGPSFLAFALVVGLAIAGYGGSRDPLANPLPLVVWNLWWVGFTFLHVAFGNLWAWLNPWRGPYLALTALPGLGAWRLRPPLAYPRWLGYWPAVVSFLAFAWFELVYHSPQDPGRLAGAVTAYVGATLAAMLLFGEAAWLRHGEAFSVFFRMVSWLSPLGRAEEAGRDAGPLPLAARLPGLRLLEVGALPPSGMAFVLLALASVSFDGLSRTFWWLGLVGVNPLEYPGRTALIISSSLGLLATFGALVLVYVVAVSLGRALAGQRVGHGAFGRFVVAIVPIAFGYHFAHYLPAFLVDAQYAVRALSDPFALGWNLFGTARMHVTASFLANHQSVQVIWNLQVVGIVAAHVAAVAVAHFLALRNAASPREAVLSQAPMTVLMIAYTLFGLWLLATPAVG